MSTIDMQRYIERLMAKVSGLPEGSVHRNMVLWLCNEIALKRPNDEELDHLLLEIRRAVSDAEREMFNIQDIIDSLRAEGKIDVERLVKATGIGEVVGPVRATAGPFGAAITAEDVRAWLADPVKVSAGPTPPLTAEDVRAWLETPAGAAAFPVTTPALTGTAGGSRLFDGFESAGDAYEQLGEDGRARVVDGLTSAGVADREVDVKPAGALQGDGATRVRIVGTPASHEIVLSGYSDDCHNLTVDGKKHDERYREFVVHIRLGDKYVRATMEFAGPGWRCRITTPAEAVITVDKQDPKELE